jgi:Rrf2 family protein
MLKINRQTDYAVRVILTLSKRKPGTRVSTSEIRREMLIPPVLIQRIVAQLASGGFINTQPGRDGGVTLAHAPSEINLLQVVEHFEGPVYLSDCVIKPEECPFSTRCPVTRRWARLKNVIRAELEATTFEQLVNDAIAIDAQFRNSASATQTTDSVMNELGLSVE